MVHHGRNCVSSNNGDSKFTTPKTLIEVKIKRSFEGLGTKIGIVGVRRNYGTVKRKSETVQRKYEGGK